MAADEITDETLRRAVEEELEWGRGSSAKRPSVSPGRLPG